jgi:hypothetical protein
VNVCELPCDAGDDGCGAWSQQFAGSGWGTAIATDGEGNVLVAGSFSGTADFGGGPLTAAGGADMFVAKLDSTGQPIWSRHMDHFGLREEARDIEVDGAGNVTVLGQSDGAEARYSPVIRLDADGRILWSRYFDYGTTGGAAVHGIAVDSAGNLLIIGMLSGTVDFGGGSLTSVSEFDMFVVELDAAGRYVWGRQFHGSGGITGLAVDGADNVLLTGMFDVMIDLGGGPLTGTGTGWNDMFVAKLGPTGQHVWSRHFAPATVYLGPDNIAVDSTGNVLVLGRCPDMTDFGGGPLTSPVGGCGTFVVKLDAGGRHVWSQEYGQSDDAEHAGGIATDRWGNVLVTVSSMRTMDFGGGPLIGGGFDIVVARLRAAGELLWSDRFGDASTQLPMAIAADGAGNILLTGSFGGTLDFGTGLLDSENGSIFVTRLVP